MVSQIFFSDHHKKLEGQVKDLLNSHGEFLSKETARSPRAVGDAIEEILRERFGELLGDVSVEYSADFARRAMADLAFTDTEGFYYVVDVKTHRTDTKFNMPNLTSVERLTRFYEDDKNYFVILMVSYKIAQKSVAVSGVRFVPIEFLRWDCLTIGALGWGQIQIANSNKVLVDEHPSRRRWMLELCDVMLDFYPKEILKVNSRIERFEEVRQYWLKKAESSPEAERLAA